MNSLECNINCKIKIEKENQTPQFFFTRLQKKKIVHVLTWWQWAMLAFFANEINLEADVNCNWIPAPSTIVWLHHPFGDLALCCGHLLSAKMVDYSLILWRLVNLMILFSYISYMYVKLKLDMIKRHPCCPFALCIIYYIEIPQDEGIYVLSNFGCLNKS